MILPFTEANFMTFIMSAEGTPYRFGGIDPFHGGADCSGLIYWAGIQCGVTLPRTTQTEWQSLPHSSNWGAAPVGSIVEFEVPGDGGQPPQHVGIVTGGGFMIDDPHTGAVVHQEKIPNEPGVIWPIGYCTLPFLAPPQPNPTPPQEIYKPLTGRYGTLNKPAVVIVDRPQNDGYWIVASDGGLFNYAKAPFVGSLGSLKLNEPVIGAACTPSGNGLWMVATDGGIFAFGDAQFYGSMGGKLLAAPVVSMAATKSGNGYWLIGADGGVFAFGDAVFLGSPA